MRHSESQPQTEVFLHTYYNWMKGQSLVKDEAEEHMNPKARPEHMDAILNLPASSGSLDHSRFASGPGSSKVGRKETQDGTVNSDELHNAVVLVGLGPSADARSEDAVCCRPELCRHGPLSRGLSKSRHQAGMLLSFVLTSCAGCRSFFVEKGG